MAQQQQPQYPQNAGTPQGQGNSQAPGIPQAPQYTGYPRASQSGRAPQYSGAAQYGGYPYYPPYPPYQAGPGTPYPGMPYAYGAPGAVPPGAVPPGRAGAGAGPQMPGVPQGAAYGMPRYAAGMPSRAAQPPRRRKNRAPLVAALLCVGLVVLVSLTAAAIGVMQRSGAVRERPEPGEVPSFTIEAPPDEMDDGLSTVEIARTVSPSVVCINVYEPGSILVAGSGSGIILNEEGFIVTNAHVVETPPPST